MRKGTVECEPYKARTEHTSSVKLKDRLPFITLGNPVAEGVNDAANHHLGKNWVGLEGLLVGRPVVLRHVAQDLKDGPPMPVVLVDGEELGERVGAGAEHDGRVDAAIQHLVPPIASGASPTAAATGEAAGHVALEGEPADVELAAPERVHRELLQQPGCGFC